MNMPNAPADHRGIHSNCTICTIIKEHEYSLYDEDFVKVYKEQEDNGDNPFIWL